ncbi:MAG TPA: type III pantothenate kinase, partial [Terrimicrobiaceae bacterium]
MRPAEFVLVDISNSFTKVAFSSRERIGGVSRVPTNKLTPGSLGKLLGARKAKHAVVASVVPARNRALTNVLPSPICWVSHKIPLGIGIDYPRPETIGADRLANAAAAVALYGFPAVVVDFGTAVTFDVISPVGDYAGGVIAPGLGAMTDYLHTQTALL